MQAVYWRNEISASWKRALDLKSLQTINSGLHLQIEEESGKVWSLVFEPVQAWKVTAEECAGVLLATLPKDGALYMLRDSEWLDELGDAQPLKQSEHYIVCCYDQVVEVLAWNCLIKSVD
jgi:hypothetical protein